MRTIWEVFTLRISTQKEVEPRPDCPRTPSSRIYSYQASRLPCECSIGSISSLQDCDLFQWHSNCYFCLCVCVCVCVCVQSLSPEWLFVTPWVCSLPGSSVHEDSPGRRAGVGLLFPTPGNLPNSGIKPTSLVSPELGGGFFTSAPPGKLFLLISLKLIRAYLPKKYCILSLPC